VKKSALASLLALAALAGPARAQVEFSGYLKNFWEYSRDPLDGRPYNLDTTRLRLTVDAQESIFQGHVDFDDQFAAGSYFRTESFDVFGYNPPEPWLPMQHTVSTGTTNAYGIGAYRAWVGVKGDDALARFGRQRIAWGTGKIWNPTDVLNPYQPTSVEPDERRGVDAFYARAGLGTLGLVEYVWAPNDTWPNHAMLARLHGDAGGWDWSLLGGKTAVSTASFMAGGDFAGNLADGTLHGELAYFTPTVRTPYWKAGLGYDYIFSNETCWSALRNASVVVEYFHAGNGAANPAQYDFAPVLAGTEVSVAQNYFGTTFSRDLNPLLKFSAVAIVNADDGSTFAAPQLTWNALNNLYLSASLQRFGGGASTEYGRQPNLGVLMAQYYF
jgi:hypothetical protein